MSVARSGSSSSAAAAEAARARAAAEAAAKKAAAEAAKKKAAAEAAKKKAAQEALKKKDSFDAKKHLKPLTGNFSKNKADQIGKLANGKGTASYNKDGSKTTTLEQTKKGVTTRQELTTSRDKLTRETKLKLEETRTQGGRETKNAFTSQTDLFGRATSSQKNETTKKKGDVTTGTSRQVDVDLRGNRKVTEGKSHSTEKGNTTTSNSSSVTKGAFDTRQKVVENKVEVKNGNATTTTSNKSTTGTDFSLSNSREFKDGTFTIKDSADWKKNSFNKEVGKEKEWKLKDPSADKGFSQVSKNDKLDKAQKLGDLAGAAGLKKTVLEEKKWDTTGKPEEMKSPSFVGSRVGTRGEGKLEIGADGISGNIKREAVAGLYAEKTHEGEGKYGKYGYEAQAKIEAKATAEAQGKINLNGADLSAGAKVGVSAEASVKGTAQTKSVKLAGVDLSAGVEGTARVSAEASAEATGKLKITRNPATAILEGKAGASAVVKAEGSIKANAGPFAVKASGYGSAGAEATASGVIGYQDGKLKLGGSLGAAVGLGLGGSVQVEVDVKAIGTMAKNTADVNGDGKLGLDDVGAAASKAKSAVTSTVSSAASKVRSWMPW